jgi:hypothetical protein
MTAVATAHAVAGPLEPATQAFIDSLAGGTPIYTLSPEAARDVLAGAQKSVSVTLAPARSEDRVSMSAPRRAPTSGSIGRRTPKARCPLLVDENDVLRDEGAMAAKPAAAGVPVTSIT